MARLFFAVFPDAETRERIAAAARALELAGRARLVTAENYHMTLAFLGEVPDLKVAMVRKVGSTFRARGFAVRFDAYEYWSQAKVIVAAARELPSSLQTLWQQLQASLAKHHPARDQKPLKPHITIARQVRQAPLRQTMAPFSWKMQEFSLVRSDTGGTASLYTVVDTWPLLDKDAAP
jgi:RNA 2',3'-cyclic 3'-phosphodiesterase